VDENSEPRELVTIEQEERFQTCFPSLVEAFSQELEESKASKPKSKKQMFYYFCFVYFQL
jgi:hypothetical protein